MRYDDAVVKYWLQSLQEFEIQTSQSLGPSFERIVNNYYELGALTEVDKETLEIFYADYC